MRGEGGSQAKGVKGVARERALGLARDKSDSEYEANLERSPKPS